METKYENYNWNSLLKVKKKTSYSEHHKMLIKFESNEVLIM